MSGRKPAETPLDDVPDLILPSPSKKPEAPPRTVSASQMAAVALPHDQKAIAISTSEDDDDFDMHLERDNPALMPMPAQPAASGRSSGPSLASSGIDLASPLRTSGRPRPSGASYEAAPAGKALGFAVAFVVFAGAAVALVKFAHTAGGRPVTSLLPKAFDGTSTIHSGAVSLGALVFAIALGYLGARRRPKVIGFLVSATAFLIASFAMVTVTLVSTEENPVPADGLLLLPYVVPAALVTLGLGLAERAAFHFASRAVARKVAAIPLAAVGGVLAFLAYETSFLLALKP